MTDIDENRLKFASKLGADHVLLIDSNDSKFNGERVVNLLGAMPDVTIECSGAESSIQLGIYVNFG